MSAPETHAPAGGWLAAIAAEDGIGTLILAGAGTGTALPALDRIARAVLIEPSPACQPALRALTGDGRVRVEPVALSEAEGRAPLTLFNMEGLASLRAPGPDLQALFPSLRKAGQTEVPTTTLPAIVETLGLAAEESHVLVIDTPGQVADLLDQLLGAGLARHFRDLVLCGANDALFEGGGNCQERFAALEAAGLEKVEEDVSDPDFPHYRFRRTARPPEPAAPPAGTQAPAAKDDATARIAALEADLERLRKNLAQETQLKRLREGDLDELRLQLAELTERNARLAALLEEAAARLRAAADRRGGPASQDG